MHRFIIIISIAFAIIFVSFNSYSDIDLKSSNDFASPAAMQSYRSFGDITSTPTIIDQVESFMKKDSGEILIAYRSSGCSRGCSSGCSMGCSSGCSSGCSTGCSSGCSYGCSTGCRY